MKAKPLFWKLLPSYLLITLSALIAIGWYASGTMRRFFYDQVAEDLTASARVMRTQLAGAIHRGDTESLRSLCRTLGQAAGQRITVIAASGNVLADSQENPAQMDNHANRPEVILAKQGQHDYAVRFSHTLGVDMMYVAVPVRGNDNSVSAIVRVAKPVHAINHELATVHRRIVLAGLLIAAAAAVVSFLAARTISTPLVALQQGAQRFADGHFSHHLPMGNGAELDAVAAAMNQMAEQIDARLGTIMRQKNEHRAVLGSMSEAVLAVDNQQRVIMLNRSAAEIIDADINTAKGRTLPEVVRNTALQEFVTEALNSNDPTETTMTLHQDHQERFLLAKSRKLHDEQQREIGVLVVLNDITRLRQLEQVRRDFVANVSHELKTPITSIKGFVETLQDGAIDNPEHAKRFLEIIARQSQRMDAIIDDLLSLSRIEQQADQPAIALQDGAIRTVLTRAIDICRHKAEEKHIAIAMDCPEQLTAAMNMPLLEQAVVNLIDNAVKYSADDSNISVTAQADDTHCRIRVTDTGCGIDAEFQNRIFERFFRVDKARSRTAGGTGLGLAIVKHIAQLHGGTVTVDSILGRGSTFTILLNRK